MSQGTLSGTSNNETDDIITWRRLQLSKSKLKGVTEMAALMAGFSVVATVELNYTCKTPAFLLYAFVITTAGLVSTTMLSIMIATCVLPHVDSIAKTESIRLARDSPHEDMIWYIDLAWFLANNVSIFFFIIDVVLLCWIQFPTGAAASATAIMIPVLIILCVFSIIFYRKTVTSQIHLADQRLDELRALSVKLKMNHVNGGSDESESSNGDFVVDIPSSRHYAPRPSVF